MMKSKYVITVLFVYLGVFGCNSETESSDTMTEAGAEAGVEAGAGAPHPPNSYRP